MLMVVISLAKGRCRSVCPSLKHAVRAHTMSKRDLSAFRDVSRPDKFGARSARICDSHPLTPRRPLSVAAALRPRLARDTAGRVAGCAPLRRALAAGGHDILLRKNFESTFAARAQLISRDC